MKAYEYSDGFIAIECKGCNEVHLISSKHVLPNGHGPWGFNGNFDNPTFTPSVNIHIEPSESSQMDRRCHFIITDGFIEYCGDCTHELKGQKIELPNIEP